MVFSRSSNCSPPLRVHKSDIDHLPPLERILALHLIKKNSGDFVIISEGSTGGSR